MSKRRALPQSETYDYEFIATFNSARMIVTKSEYGYYRCLKFLATNGFISWAAYLTAQWQMISKGWVLID